MTRRSIKDLELSSDNEVWTKHPFKFSRVINNGDKATASRSRPARPPPFESFSYANDSKNKQPPSSSNNCPIEIESSSEEGKVENLEDDDAGCEATNRNRSRRFVIEDDDEEDENEVQNEKEVQNEIDSSDFDFDDEVEEEEDEDEDDVIKKALRKCGSISAELKRELYGTTASACDTYSVVDVNSSIGIVTQDDVNKACVGQDSELELLLKPYQLVGVNFLLLLYRKKIGGAILADEMGLGKTIQAVTYLTLLKHLHNDSGPHLIVCPASVLENWERELKKWSPSLTVLLYHGPARSTYSKKLSSALKAGSPHPYNVILVGYSLFERRSSQQKDERKILKHIPWSCVLMDEAHALKDKSSYRWKNLVSVTRSARQRLMLTGTPLQNDLHELWSMLEFMLPDLFQTGDVDLKKLLNAEDKDLIAQIKSILGPFILRRLKSDVMQQLVRKIQKVEYVKMADLQAGAYREAIENYRAACQARISKMPDIDPKNMAGVLPRRQISNYFHEFRKIANHPLLVRRIYRDDDIIYYAKILHPRGAFGYECSLERVVEELKGYSDFSIHRLLLYYGDTKGKGTLSDEHAMTSGKCHALYELLPVLKRKGHRVLIFSQWTSMLDILEWTLDVIGVTYSRLDGSTQVTERQTIVDTFNKDSSVFACLLSTRAGGQGLNLTGADTVIIHDMDFNPQIDRQAEDRCHRIGQTKAVTIYRLVTKDTVDENVYEIAKRKLTLDAAVLQSGVEVDNEGVVSDMTMGEILSSLLLG